MFIRIKREVILLLLFSLLGINSVFSQNNHTSFVNPFIGTGAVDGSSLSGNNYPGATVPFGMIQLSPDTQNTPDWSIASGYNYNDSIIFGFSHTHLSGTGVPELFDVMLMPFRDIKSIGNSAPGFEYASRFLHQSESASPGYYQVQLADHGVNVELTATHHAGFHRYSFGENDHAFVLLDLDHSLRKSDWNTKIIGAHMSFPDPYTVEGYRVISSWSRFRKVYFQAKFSKPIVSHLVKNGGIDYPNVEVANGQKLRVILDFGKELRSEVLVKIGFSSVSLENARQNLKEEIPHWSFDEIVIQADHLWENELQKIEIEASTEQKQIFYTALYHTFLQPNNIADINGEYSASDFVTRKSPDSTYFSTFSLWDTYRAAHPLYTILQPKRTASFINSMLAHYDSYGYLPVWQLWGQENYCMIGNHSIPVIVDAALKGLPGFDLDAAYSAVKNLSMRAHLNAPFDVWEKFGYFPENIQSQSVSLTLEVAYDDWCVAQLAK
jgi:predicted alpha-1,2-mannosidase